MEKRELFQIGEMAKMFHLSVGSLRYYEKIGLLEPEYVDQETGYRYYSTGQFECLNTILYLRVLDMPLSQIASFLKNRDIGKIQEMLRQQKDVVVRKQEELKSIEKKITNRLRQIQDALGAEKERIQVKRVKPRRIAWLKDHLAIADKYHLIQHPLHIRDQVCGDQHSPFRIVVVQNRRQDIVPGRRVHPCDGFIQEIQFCLPAHNQNQLHLFLRPFGQRLHPELFINLQCFAHMIRFRPVKILIKILKKVKEIAYLHPSCKIRLIRKIADDGFGIGAGTLPIH